LYVSTSHSRYVACPTWRILPVVSPRDMENTWTGLVTRCLHHMRDPAPSTCLPHARATRCSCACTHAPSGTVSKWLGPVRDALAKVKGSRSKCNWHPDRYVRSERRWSFCTPFPALLSIPGIRSWTRRGRGCLHARRSCFPPTQPGSPPTASQSPTGFPSTSSPKTNTEATKIFAGEARQTDRQTDRQTESFITGINIKLPKIRTDNCPKSHQVGGGGLC
jgi:hypothetical protein